MPEHKETPGMGTPGESNTSKKTPDANQHICSTGKCALGTPCVCAFYADWTVDELSGNRTPEPVSVQLQRRRAAAYRCPRLACGRRDPISASIL
jgi:hypothetical protein